MSINQIISSCNADTVKESIARIRSLPYTNRKLLKNEFHRNPDLRFSDNLLIALSYTNDDLLIDDPITIDIRPYATIVSQGSTIINRIEPKEINIHLPDGRRISIDEVVKAFTAPGKVIQTPYIK